MVDAVTSLSHIGLTLLGLFVGWLIVIWLDRNVFNKDRYPKNRKK